ncbi:hypothetical protein, partial [Accumulibacter sp.]|uniref:hypothetical protein n=1 Tax=Accumulibacter sp. TaxID=2053492 RepID=UPI002C73E684
VYQLSIAGLYQFTSAADNFRHGRRQAPPDVLIDGHRRGCQMAFAVAPMTHKTTKYLVSQRMRRPLLVRPAMLEGLDQAIVEHEANGTRQFTSGSVAFGKP